MTNALSESINTTNSEGTVVMFRRDEYSDSITPLNRLRSDKRAE